MNELEYGSLFTVGISSDLLIEVIYEIIILYVCGLAREDIINIVVCIQLNVVGVPRGARVEDLSAEVIRLKVEFE